MTAMTIVNTLAKAWKMVEDNSVLDVSTQVANAVPADADWVTDLSQGGGPNFFEWEWRGPGLIKADFWFHMRVNWTYGSRYRGGGAFITACWPEIVDYNIWTPGYTIHIDANVRYVQNVGADGRAPIAEIGLATSIAYHWYIEAMANSGGTCNFALRGNGSGAVHYDDMSYDS